MKKGATRGAENVGNEDVIIPRIELVQSLSPARKKTDPGYIEGCEEGHLFNNVTRELYGPEVEVVPVYYAKQFLVWKDRKQGGGTNGFRGAFASPELAQKAIAELGEEGLDVVDTAQHFVLVKHEGKWQEAVVSMSKSKFKVSKRWNSLIRLTNADSFAKRYRLYSVTETNANNESYYNFGVSGLGFVDKETYERAEKLYEAVSRGAVKVNTDFEGVVDAEPAAEY